MPAPSDPVSTCASSEKSRPAGDRGTAIAISGLSLFSGRLISTGTSSLARSCGPRIAPVPAVGQEGQHQPDQQAASSPLGTMSSGFGLDGFGGGMALLMIDPPDGLASAAVSCATWLFSELSWL